MFIQHFLLNCSYIDTRAILNRAGICYTVKCRRMLK